MRDLRLGEGLVVLFAKQLSLFLNLVGSAILFITLWKVIPVSSSVWKEQFLAAVRVRLCLTFEAKISVFKRG